MLLTVDTARGRFLPGWRSSPRDRTRGAIRALMDLAPKRGMRLVDRREGEVDVEVDAGS